MTAESLRVRSPIFVSVLVGVFQSAASADQASPALDTHLVHPLMPGVRSDEIWNRDWPRTLHDKQITGFSPLVCGMKEAPRVWATVDVGGELGWVAQVTGSDGSKLLLVNDGRLRGVTLSGEVRWTGEGSGSLVFFGDLHGDGRDRVVLEAGNRVTVLDAKNGKQTWRQVFSPPHVRVRTRVADVLPERPGLEAAVFLAHGSEGCLIDFPPAGEPKILWQRAVVPKGEWPERADHGCHIHLDLSVPDQPVIWNVRHHRCRGFEARTGKEINSLLYRVGGGYRRNYGPWAIGRSASGEPIVALVSERIQMHVHAIRLKRDGPSQLAWQHYYGELYQKPGVAAQHIAIDDVDGDDATEVVYNVRDPDQGFRSFVRVRDAETGKVECELPDQWCVGAYAGLGDREANGLVVCEAPEGATPQQGRLTVHRFVASGRLDKLLTVNRGSAWGPLTLPGSNGNDLLLREITAEGVVELVRYRLRNDRLEAMARTRAPALIESQIRNVLRMPDGEQAFLVAGSRGRLEAVTWAGKRLWDLPLAGGPSATVSAADLDGDGRAELVTTAAGHRVRVLSFDGTGRARELATHEFVGTRSRYSPMLYDLEGSGQLCLIAPGRTLDGYVAVRAYRPDGSLLWGTELDMPTADRGMAVAWNAGQFLPGPRSAVAISVANAQRTKEGTYLLDGPTGKARWFKGLHRDGNIVRGCKPMGLPLAFDSDGDGVEEICMDMYSYLALLRGTDGSFAFLRHTRNIRSQGALYAGLLYNSYCPVFKTPEATKPHWFVPLGHGCFGFMNPDPSTGVWRETIGYDVPPRAGMVDVAGDGVMEVGYAALNSNAFKCRNLWTGEVEWTLELPSPPNCPVIAADVDGDGKGEFLTGWYCIGTDSDGKGVIRWKSPRWLNWGAIADFDGDGLGEIVCPTVGAVYILKGTD